MRAKIIPFNSHRKQANGPDAGHSPVDRGGILISEFMHEFLKYSESVHTVKTQKHFGTAFREFIRIAGDVPVRDIDIRNVESFLAKKKNEASCWTAAKYYIALSSAWETARRWEYVEENVFRKIKKPRTHETAPEYFTKEDFRKLISFIDDRDFLELVTVGVNTGFRLNELLNLRWRHIDFNDKVIRIQNSDQFQTKTKRNRVVPMNESVLSIMSERSKRVRSDFVFSNNGKPLNGMTVSARFKRYVRRARLDEKLRFHSLRHTCATWLIKAGVPIYEVQILMGHSNISTTERYVHLAASDLHGAVNKISF